MSNTRNAILTAIQTAIAGVEGMHADRVLIGNPTLRALDKGSVNRPVASIIWQDDAGKRADGGLTKRTMRITVGVLIKVDASADSEPLLQLGTTYDAIHAALETLAENDVGARANMVEDAGGVQASGFADGNESYTFIASSWIVEYKRTRGQQ